MGRLSWLRLQSHRRRLKTEYGYGLFPNVVTSIQLERMLSYGGPPRCSSAIGWGTSKKSSLHSMCWVQRSFMWTRLLFVDLLHVCRQAGNLAYSTRAGTTATIFQMDLRSFGKGYDKYIGRIQSEEAVEYRRSAVSTVKQVPGSKDLLVSFIDADGTQSAGSVLYGGALRGWSHRRGLEIWLTASGWL